MYASNSILVKVIVRTEDILLLTIEGILGELVLEVDVEEGSKVFIQDPFQELSDGFYQKVRINPELN